MSQQVKDLVSSCSLCANFAPAQAKEPLMTPELLKRPWSVIAQDLYSLGGKYFLISVDTYSGFWEVDELPETTAADVISKTKQHLARYEIPDRVYSDNGPQFDCTKYASSADDWQFEHFTSSPYHKQSNELVEAAVKSAKTLQKKANWARFVDELPGL
jgi:transposase InsO family protein